MLPHLGAQVFARVARTGDENARRNRNEKRRNLGDEPVADRENAVELKRRTRRHVVLHDAHDRAADDVDGGDDHPRDAVAFYELHRAVHGPVHFAFHLHGVAAPLCFFHVDDARTQVRVDRHLFPGHRIERETRAHFRHALRSLGDDEKLHDREDEKDDRAHDEIAPRGEFAEGVNDFTRVGLQKNEARRRDVEPDAKERREKEHRREGREFQGRLHVHRHHEHHEGDREVGADEGVDECRGHRQDHERDDDDEKRHHRKVAVACDRIGDASRFPKECHGQESLRVRVEFVVKSESVAEPASAERG